MTHQCAFCGCEIQFRVIRGVTVPLHSGDQDCIGRQLYRRDTSDVCHATVCRDCKQKVFFVRHNGGSVWFDPPLGHPWPKHDCPSKTRTQSRIHRQDWMPELDPWDTEALQAEFDSLKIAVTVRNFRRRRGYHSVFIAGKEPHIWDALDVCHCQKKRWDVIYHVVPGT